MTPTDISIPEAAEKAAYDALARQRRTTSRVVLTIAFEAAAPTLYATWVGGELERMAEEFEERHDTKRESSHLYAAANHPEASTLANIAAENAIAAHHLRERAAELGGTAAPSRDDGPAVPDQVAGSGDGRSD